MKNLHQYNEYVQCLESEAKGGLLFHHINTQIYITDFTHRLLGIWDINSGQAVDWKDC